MQLHLGGCGVFGGRIERGIREEYIGLCSYETLSSLTPQSSQIGITWPEAERIRPSCHWLREKVDPGPKRFPNSIFMELAACSFIIIHIIQLPRYPRTESIIANKVSLRFESYTKQSHLHPFHSNSATPLPPESTSSLDRYRRRIIV